MKNGVRVKTRLNQAILASAWGQMATFNSHKALRADKLMIKVAPQYSSRGYTHDGNRPTQAASPAYAVDMRTKPIIMRPL